MISRGTWVWLALALAIGFGLFQLKYQVQGLEQKLARLNRQTLESEEAIHVLKAEWSYLNQPERIQALAQKYLALQPLSGKQFGSVADLPMRAGADNVGPAPPRQATPPAKPDLLAPPGRAAPPAGTRVTLARDVQ